MQPEFISRTDAESVLKFVGIDTTRFHRLRNYEIEWRLAELFGGAYVITDWCPFNSRFCEVGHYVPYPHPPDAGESMEHSPYARMIRVPWNSWRPGMTVRLRERLGHFDDAWEDPQS